MYEKEVDVALNAIEAAAGITSHVQKNRQILVYEKSDISPVTVADFASQAVICRAIGTVFPEDTVMAEENSSEIAGEPGFAGQIASMMTAATGEEIPARDILKWVDFRGRQGAARCWILDPVDGTKGFLRGDQYAIALALMVNGELELGMLGCPNLAYDDHRRGCLFIARRGQGAVQVYLEDDSIRKSIHVSSESAGDELVFVESAEPAHTNQDAHGRLYESLGVVRPPVRIDSQAKYAIVARGEASAYIRTRSRSNPRFQKAWDHAAGTLLVQEAGGAVTDCSGQDLDFTVGENLSDNNGILATNGKCHPLVLDKLRGL